MATLKLLTNVSIDGFYIEAKHIVDKVEDEIAESLVERGLAEISSEQPTFTVEKGKAGVIGQNQVPTAQQAAPAPQPQQAPANTPAPATANPTPANPVASNQPTPEQINKELEGIK